MQGTPGVVSTEVGTKPGDPLGDIAFNFVFSRVLRVLEERLKATGVQIRMPAADDAMAQAEGRA